MILSRSNLTLAALSWIGVAALGAPLAAQTHEGERAPTVIAADSAMQAAPAAMTGASSSADIATMGLSPSSRLEAATPVAIADAGAILRWNSEFAQLDAASAALEANLQAGAKPHSFALEAISPSFGEPESVSSEYALVGGLTFQPRAPVRQATGAEFEQTYAFGPSANATARHDEELTTVGRATNFRLKL